MVLVMKSMTSWLDSLACLLLVQGSSPLDWGMLEFFGARTCSYWASFSLSFLILLSRWFVESLYRECSLGRRERFMWLPRWLLGREFPVRMSLKVRFCAGAICACCHGLFACRGLSRWPSGVRLLLSSWRSRLLGRLWQGLVS